MLFPSHVIVPGPDHLANSAVTQVRQQSALQRRRESQRAQPRSWSKAAVDRYEPIALLLLATAIEMRKQSDARDDSIASRPSDRHHRKTISLRRRPYKFAKPSPTQAFRTQVRTGVRRPALQLPDLHRRGRQMDSYLPGCGLVAVTTV